MFITLFSSGFGGRTTCITIVISHHPLHSWLWNTYPSGEVVGHIDIAQMEREGSITNNVYNDLCVSRYVSCVHVVMLRGTIIFKVLVMSSQATWPCLNKLMEIHSQYNWGMELEAHAWFNSLSCQHAITHQMPKRYVEVWHNVLEQAVDNLSSPKHRPLNSGEGIHSDLTCTINLCISDTVVP